MNTTDIDLHKTPLREWPAEAIVKMVKKVAKYWKNDPAFNKDSGHIYSQFEDRSAEISTRVLEYLLKKQTDDNADQVGLFHQISGYVKQAMITDSYSIPAHASGLDSGEEGDDNPKEIVDRSSSKMQEGEAQDSARILELLALLGFKEKHFALFESGGKDLHDGLGISERQITIMRKKSCDEFAERAKTLGVWNELMGFLGVKPSQINEVRPRNSKTAPKGQTVKIFYHTIKTGLTLAQQSEIDALRFHWVGPDEYEVRQWEPGGHWEYKCRVFVEASSDTMDMNKVFKAFKGLA